MPRIIFVNRFFYPDHSATSQILSDIAFALARLGRVRVVTSRQRYEDAGARLRRHETIEGVEIERVWTTRFGRARLGLRALDYLTFYVSAARSLARTVRPGDVVVLETDPPMLSVVLTGLLRRRGASVVNWLQDLFPEIGRELKVAGLSGPLGRRLVSLRNRSLTRADANVCVGESMQRRLADQGVDNTVVIHNWADGESIRPVAPDENPLRSEWQLGGCFVVGYSGNLGRAHDFESILTAAERLKESRELRFLFIGGGVAKPWLQREAERRGLKSFVFKPYQPRSELMYSLTAADVHLVSLKPNLEGYVVPSKFYGVAAAGRPTVFLGDSRGQIATTLELAECGDTVAPEDGAGLARVLEAWMADGGLVRRMGANARAVFERSYSMTKACEAWESLIRGLADRADDRPAAGEG